MKLTVDDMVWEGLIRFSSSSWKLLTTGTPDALKWGGTHNSGKAENGIYELWANRQDENGNYSSQAREYSYFSFTSSSGEYLLAEGSSVMSFNVKVAAMPVYDSSDLNAAFDAHYLFSGLNVGLLHDNDASKDAGYAISISRIQNEDGYEGLYLIVKTEGDPVVIPLNKGLNETFNMRFEYTRDSSDSIGGDLDVYCDDVFLGTFEKVSGGQGYKTVGYGSGLYLISCIYDQNNMTKGEVDFSISELVYGKRKAPVLDLLDQTAMLNRQSADAVTEKLILPTEVSCNCEICKSNPLKLVWTSSDTSIMSNDGIPVAGASGKVTMTASVASLPDVKKDFVFTVLSSEVVSGTKIVHAAYGAPGYSDDTINATSADKYQMTGKFPSGASFGAMHQGGWVYLAIDAPEPITSVSATIDGMDVTFGDLAFGKKNEEFWINYKFANIPNDYTTTLKLTVNGETWEGLIHLDSSGWLHLSGGTPASWHGNASGSNDGNGNFTFQTTGAGAQASAYVTLGGATQSMSAGTSVTDFDICVEEMPLYDASNLLTAQSSVQANGYLFPGMHLAVVHEKDQPHNAGYVAVISRVDQNNDYDGLSLIVASAAGPVVVPLNKEEQDSFHLRLEYTRQNAGNVYGRLTVYCDDVCVGIIEDVIDVHGFADNSGFSKGISIVPWVKGENNISGKVMKFTVSKVIYGTQEAHPLDSIQPETILGENEDIDFIAAPLNLSTNSDTLEWFSSDLSIMGNDGVPVEGATGAVTMTVRMKAFPTIRKSFTFFVAGNKFNMEALLAADGITVDGKADELVWVNWTPIAGRTEAMPKGSLSAAWNRGSLYLLLASDNTDSMVLNINNTAVTVDIANKSVPGITDATVATMGNVVEVMLPFDALNIQLSDYGHAVSMSVKLANTAGNSYIALDKVIFTGYTAGTRSLSNTNSGWAFDVDTYYFDYINDDAVHYIYSSGNKFSKDETTYITQELYFDKLPAVEPMYVDGLSTRGYYFYASRNSDNYAEDSLGDILFIGIYHNGDGQLKAKIMENQAEPNAIVDLGVSVQEHFRLTSAWAADGSVKLYVNGILVGQSNGSCTYRRTGCGDNTLSFRYYGTGTTDDIAFQLKNVTVVKETYHSVKDEMTPAAVLNRADLERVAGDLPMGTTYASKFLGDLPISWATSDPNVVEANGTVHRGETTKSCTISLIFNGETLWTKQVTVLSASEAEKPSAAKYNTAFANDIVINGDLLGENWHMANKILDQNGYLVGEMGAAWNLQNLYIAIRNNRAEITLKVNDVVIDLAQVNTAANGAYTEIAIPMDLVYPNGITGYGVELPIVVTVGDGTYSGTLVLVGTDWWGAGNKQQSLPVLDGNYNSITTLVGVPDGNQAVIEVENGWHFYDRYSDTGSNPSGIRSYVLFYRTSPYENFDKRDGTTTVEFDFQANNMPIYDETATQTQNPDAFACYGVNWILADASNSQKYSNVVAAGIYNSADGLILVLRGPNTEQIPLNRKVGDLFRITMNWNTDNSLDVYIDGELLHTVSNMAQWVSSVGDCAFVLNMIRDLENPTSAADDMDVYVTNIAFGSAYPDSMLSTLSWDTIRGENTDLNAVTSNLVLPAQLVNEQLGHEHTITWTSSEPSVVNPVTGEVNQPETGAVSVKLTAKLADGSSKVFTMIVIGKKAVAGDVLVVRNDTNPSTGKGTVSDAILFTFDADNNSVIVDLKESKNINLVTLTDLDNYARINRESVTLWVSGDNETYTQIKDYKLTQAGNHWYLYDFEAEGRYIKAHYTHWNGNEADFIASLNTIISATWNDSLAIPENAAESDVPATTLRDQAVAITLPEGIEAAGLRVAMNGNLLFHYVDKDGTVYVRIPDPTTGKLQLWNAADIELANKENVYEVTYGTRETYKLDDNLPPRWLLSIKVGTYGNLTAERDMLIATSSTSMYAGKILVSYDQGLTWETLGNMTEAAKNACVGDGASNDSGDGGWIFDDATGTIYYICHKYMTYDSAWVNSDCVNVVIASYDMGQTWVHVDTIEPDVVDGNTYSYMLSYSGGIKVSSYDGDGSNIDFVFPTCSQCSNTGSFCARVAYSTDGGKTWVMSKNLITYGKSLGDESGLSEAWIAENEDGVLVLFSRCQYEDTVNFAQAYSYDFGLTWTACETREAWEAQKDTAPIEIVAKKASIYSSNTQPLIYNYAQYNGIEAPLFFWGGNNTLGGASYIRSPMNVAVSYDGLETWRNIQNLFSETFLERYNGDGRSLITNHSAAKVGDDTMLLTFVQNRATYRQGMTVTDFENFFYRTKGVYDGFETGNPHYEGWSAETGLVSNTDALASEGEQSMFVPKKSILTRSIPYLQNGTITLDIYVDANTAVTYALQPAFGKDPNAYTLTTFRVEGKKLTNGSTSLDLKDGWNTVQIRLELTNGNAWFSVNGCEEASAVLNMNVGDYVCYFTVFNDTDTYIDEFMVVSDLDAEIYTHEWDESADIYQVSPSLEDYVVLNFYVKLGADVADEDAYMVFTHNGEEHIVTAYKGTDVNRKYIYKINAKEMADDISAVFYYGGGRFQSEAKTISAKEYAEYVQQDPASQYTDSHKQVVKDMMQYGAYAQIYFNHNTGNPADANIVGASSISQVNENTMITHKSFVTDNFLPEIGLALSGSLLLKENTTLRFSFTGGDIPDGLAVLVNGNAADIVEGDGRSYVDVTGIAAKNLGDSIVLTIRYNGREMTVNYNPLSYCHSILNGDYSVELKNLVKSLYLYHLSAVNYFYG